MIKLARAAEGRRHFISGYYTRTCAEETLLVVANKSDRPAALRLPEPIRSARWRRILTNLETPRPALERTSLEPWEAEVYQKISEA